MKSFIDKIFKAKKQKEILDEIIHTKVVQENKEILSEQIETSIKERIDQNRINMEEVEKETLDVFEKQEENKVPSKSKKQHNLMAAVANNPSFAKKVGISKSVGEEFMKADKGKKFAGGGLYANIAAKKRRIAAGSGEKMRSVGSKGAPKKDDFANAAKTASYKHGGKTDIEQDKAMAKKAVGMHEKQLHGGKRSNLSALKKGGGIEVRGKTKGKIY